MSLCSNKKLLWKGLRVALICGYIHEYLKCINVFSFWTIHKSVFSNHFVSYKEFSSIVCHICISVLVLFYSWLINDCSGPKNMWILTWLLEQQELWAGNYTGKWIHVPFPQILVAALYDWDFHFFKKYFKSYFLCMGVLLDECTHTICMPVACRGQKIISVPLELELSKVVNHHVGTRNQAWMLQES